MLVSNGFYRYPFEQLNPFGSSCLFHKFGSNDVTYSFSFLNYVQMTYGQFDTSGSEQLPQSTLKSEKSNILIEQS